MIGGVSLLIWKRIGATRGGKDPVSNLCFWLGPSGVSESWKQTAPSGLSSAQVNHFTSCTGSVGILGWCESWRAGRNIMYNLDEKRLTQI